MQRQTQHLIDIGRKYPDAWRRLDQFRAERGETLPQWPGWCLMPMAGWYAIVSGGRAIAAGSEAVADIGRLAGLGAWRYSQSIYRYDPELYAHLVATPLDGDMPAEVLLRLPEWGVYVETPHGAAPEPEMPTNYGANGGLHGQSAESLLCGREPFCDLESGIGPLRTGTFSLCGREPFCNPESGIGPLRTGTFSLCGREPFCMHGFYASLEWDANDGRTELRLLLDTETGLLPVPLHIGDWPLTEAIARAIDEALRRQEKEVLPPSPPAANAALAFALAPIVNLLLYLCSDSPDFGDARSTRPQRPRPKRVKGGWRLFPPPRPTLRLIGETVGRAIRNVGKEEIDPGETDAPRPERKSPRPHLRRAHWHGFWHGPKEGLRRFRYRWIPPTFVASR